MRKIVAMSIVILVLITAAGSVEQTVSRPPAPATNPAQTGGAEYVRMPIELKGTLVQDETGQVCLMVEGQKWDLKVEGKLSRQPKKKIVWVRPDWDGRPEFDTYSANSKFVIRGAVPVTIAAPNMIVKSRTVYVSWIEEHCPTVVVTKVPAGTTASKYGLRDGDRIVRIEDPASPDPAPKLETEDDLRNALNENKGKSVEIHIIRKVEQAALPPPAAPTPPRKMADPLPAPQGGKSWKLEAIIIKDVQLPNPKNQGDSILGAHVEIHWLAPALFGPIPAPKS